MSATLTDAAAAAAADGRVRVMVVDDSVVVRSAIARILDADPRVSVVARAPDGQAALDTLRRTAVDVIVLDIEMPNMDGMTALPLLLRAAPGVRIIMASTLTLRGADIALRALRLGATDYLPKPSALGDDDFRRELLAKVAGLARKSTPAAAVPAAPRAPAAGRPAPRTPPSLLAIGSSTGGPQALFKLVPALGRDVPVPIVLTQHMPATITTMFAEHLTKLGAAPCAEVTDGAILEPGRLHLAPGNRHFLIHAEGGRFRAELSDEPPEHFCRPAVDPMLRSANAATGGRVLIAMLTGMGQDGLLGTRAVVDSGGCAVAQDEATSVVWGMPGAVAQAGLCHAVLPLEQIAPKLRSLLRLGAAA